MRIAKKDEQVYIVLDKGEAVSLTDAIANDAAKHHRYIADCKKLLNEGKETSAVVVDNDGKTFFTVSV